MYVTETLILFVLTLIIIVVYRKIVKNPKLPPGPFNLPVLGYLPWLDSKKPYISLTKLCNKYGPIYGLYLGNIYSVVIADARILKKIFSKDSALGRANLYITHRIFKGCGLIATEGDIWETHRKIVHHFLKGICATDQEGNRFIEIVARKHIVDLVEFVQSFGAKTVLDPAKLVRHSVGSVINEIITGKSWDRENKTWRHLLYLQEEGTHYLKMAGPLNFLPVLRFLPTYKRASRFLLNAVDDIQEFHRTVTLEEKRTFHCNQSATNLIQAYISHGLDSCNDQQFHHVLIDVFGAALDSTLNTLTWYLMYMALHQTVQKKVRKELSEVLQGQVLTGDDMARLPYLKASIAEVQRFQTVSPLGVPRATLEDVHVGDYVVPKGTMIIPLLWAIHKDPKVWKEPESFNPERFIDEEGRFSTPESFMPFSTGKRNCVGGGVAKILLFLFCGNVLRNFQIDLEHPTREDFDSDYGITITPNPHDLIFTALL